MNYVIVDLDQGSDEWLRWRRTGFGSSDIPIIMGDNPYETWESLIAGKRGEVQKRMNAVMARGTALEPEARDLYVEKTGFAVQPRCLQHRDYPWARASLDGLTADGKRVVEIKCGSTSFRKVQQTRRIPSHYYGQLQHILFVTGLAEMDYWAYDPDAGGIRIPVQRDDDYIARIIATCEGLKSELPS